MDTKKLLDTEIYPRLFEVADVVFPDFLFRRKGHGWEARGGDINGDSAKGHLYYYEDRPFGFKNQKDGSFITIWDYVQTRELIKEPREVLERLAQMAKYPLPELVRSPAAMERLEQERRRTKILTTAADYFARLLYEPAGASTLAYLAERGFSEELVRNTALGHYPGRDATVSHLGTHGISEEHALWALKYLTVPDRDAYALTIPYSDDQGRTAAIYGRLTRPVPDASKYLPLSDVPEGVRAVPFLLSEARRLSAARGANLVLVEGYLDAVLPAAHGIPDVVSLGGAKLTREHLETLKEHKIRSLVFALDSDEAGREGTLSGVRAATEAGFATFVLEYPGGDERKIDAYDFIRENGPEAFLALRDRAEAGTRWLTRTVLSRHDLETDLGRYEALEEITPFEESLRDAIERETLRATVSKELGLSLDALEERFGSYHAQKAREREEKAIRDAVRTAETRLGQGDTKGAREALESGAKNTKAESVRVVVSPHPLERVRLELSRRDAGLATGYPSLDDLLTIRPAVTIVGGRPSHGKTALLLNLLLNLLRDRDNAKKSFFFFSYEEDKSTLAAKLFAMMAGRVFDAHKNLEHIERYVRSGRRADSLPSATSDEELRNYGLLDAALEEYEEYVQAGRLWIVDEPLSVQSLSRTLDYLREAHDVGAVFVDYIQRVKFDGYAQDERVRIARISEELREASTRLSLPIIAGAQFNRTQTGRPRLEGLKEAGNLEEDANTVLGIYNLKTAKLKESGSEAEKSSEAAKNCKGQPAQTDDRGIDFELHLLKNRGGRINESVLLHFDAPTLRIFDWEEGKQPRGNADRNDIPF